ncbi:MAG: hypothetical protein WBD28_08970 [Candidatus Zixiibacteriota bacterium]
MGKYLSVILILIFNSIWGNAFAQTVSQSPGSVDKIVAVSIDEIKKFGITTGTKESCDNSLTLDIFTNSDLKQKIGSIPSGTIVKYQRLSETIHIPYWAPQREHRLPEGEKFIIFGDTLTGWIGESNLMTFSSVWRERIPERFLKTCVNSVVCVYSSGQYESVECSAVTLWERESPENLWTLKVMKTQPIKTCLYCTPQVDTVYVDDDQSLKFQLSSLGGDAGDFWGTRSLYSYKDGQLILLSTWNVDSIEK